MLERFQPVACEDILNPPVAVAESARSELTLKNGNCCWSSPRIDQICLGACGHRDTALPGPVSLLPAERTVPGTSVSSSPRPNRDFYGHPCLVDTRPVPGDSRFARNC